MDAGGGQSFPLSLVAVGQMTATEDKERNFATCEGLVKAAAQAGARMLFLPEGCDYISESQKSAVALAEPLDGPLVGRYCQLAASHSLWLSLGGIHIKEAGEERVYNTHMVISSDGQVVARYAKTHLFSLHIPERDLYLQESAYICPGQDIPSPITTPVGLLGLAICYDLRFPELSLIQRRLGAQILTFPSAFTIPTGLAHWSTLLRARAIETQSYVIAAAQTGKHNQKRSSYGHAMVVDPWGAVVAEVSEGAGLALANIDLNYLNKVRQEMPIETHRRPDLYQLNPATSASSPRLCDLLPPPSAYVSYKFGEVVVPGSCVFLKTALSQAFVNKKPVVPGHMLVTPERPALRFPDLETGEVADLAQVAQLVVRVVAQHFQIPNCQLAIQDGTHAGQTIEHCHLHVVPHWPDLSQQLQGHEDRHAGRDTADMEKEAQQLRQALQALLPQPCPRSSPPRKLMLSKGSSSSRQLGSYKVTSTAVVAQTQHCCAFLTSGPVLPGHVCVSTMQPSPGYDQADAQVVTDIFLMAQLVQRHLEELLECHSSTLVLLPSCQDQPLQMHVVPRQAGDLCNNDDIYNLLLCHTGSGPTLPPPDLSLAARLTKAIHSPHQEDSGASQQR